MSSRLGSRGTHDFFAGLMPGSFDSSLLKGLVSAVLRVSGRDLGRAEGAATLEVVGLPEIAVGDRVWLQAVASSLYALFAIAEVDGTVTTRDVTPAIGRVAYRMRLQAAER